MKLFAQYQHGTNPTAIVADIEPDERGDYGDYFCAYEGDPEAIIEQASKDAKLHDAGQGPNAFYRLRIAQNAIKYCEALI